MSCGAGGRTVARWEGAEFGPAKRFSVTNSWTASRVSTSLERQQRVSWTVYAYWADIIPAAQGGCRWCLRWRRRVLTPLVRVAAQGSQEQESSA